MLRFEDWGLIDYEEALALQLQKVQEVIDSQNSTSPLPGFLIFCSHPPIVTLGRKTQTGDVYAWPGAIKEISRGGRATYHGPSQLVVYPIVNLELAGEQRKPKDIGLFLRLMEEAIITVLKEFHVSAVGKTSQKKSDTLEATEETGVWVGQQKIASLGIAIKKWVSYHGAAINLDEDPEAFLGMNPCGFSKETMVSLEKLTGKNVNREQFSHQLQMRLNKSI